MKILALALLLIAMFGVCAGGVYGQFESCLTQRSTRSPFRDPASRYPQQAGTKNPFGNRECLQSKPSIRPSRS